MKEMMIDGFPHVETPEGWVRKDVIDNSKPHKVQLLLSVICAVYALLTLTVIYQLKYPQADAVIGVFSYNLLTMTMQFVGDAVIVVALEAAFMSAFILLVRIDVASQIAKALMMCALVTVIFAALAQLYGFSNPQENIIGHITVGLAINLMGRPATLVLFWLIIAGIVAKFAEHYTGWSFWVAVNEHKKKAVISLEQLQTQLKHCLPPQIDVSSSQKEEGRESIVPNVAVPEIPVASFEEQIANVRQRFTKPMQAAQSVNKSVAMTHQDLESEELGVLELVIGWLPIGGLALLSAAAGVGKTRLLLALSYAIANGQDFLGWKVFGARKVLYVDGEMGKLHMRDRMRDLGNAPKNLIVLTNDMNPKQHPNICTAAGQALIERSLFAHQMGKGTVIILDSLFTLSQEMIDYPKAHAEYQNWLLSLRYRGYTVIAAHHNNKAGLQSGSVKKNTQINASIAMNPPKGYDPNGTETRAELVFMKCRESYGTDISKSEVSCQDGQWVRECKNGVVYSWSAGDSVNDSHDSSAESLIQVNQGVNQANTLNVNTDSVRESLNESLESSTDSLNIHLFEDEKALNQRIFELHHAGKSQREISRELGVNQSKVSRILAKAS